MNDLITRKRALANLNNLTPTVGETTSIDLLIRAVSRSIQSYCHREFALRNYDELYDGAGTNFLALRNYPIVAVERVASSPQTVLSVINTSTANQRATVQVAANGLTLVCVASGVTTTDASITWSDFVTFDDVAAAVIALGNGWSATVSAGNSNRASMDLRPIQGALNAKDQGAELVLHVEELGDYRVDERGGWLYRCGGWLIGTGNYRVIYTAGYETVPEDVQEACAEWVAALFYQTRRDSGLSQDAIPGVVSRTSVLSVHGMMPQVKALLAPYRKYRV